MVMVGNIINDFMDIQVRLLTSWFKYHEFRGAQVSEEEKKRLNELGGKILREAGLDFEVCNLLKIDLKIILDNRFLSSERI